ncbi:pantoate--beta-alanine ligase [Falsiroseomonas selenitidurans]|uniref:Pantothenate synthetase n=1 Tax=Falsiroseomonas selenitidurans TaxID=2716335 RepID=A0ABX1E0D2_9PROT|nr:pantoate--beta-alanine ligase [Falsiroseomonas selenitidurans]NKC29288.1 pantoate--beta-alanine ligase [Falsiroseomonas selenitidurans]
MLILRDLQALRRARAEACAGARRLALVPTMGALHQGHLALVAAARAAAETVAVSIFVNPLQFNPAEDLSRYPRDEEGDLAKLESAGCDLVWMPDVPTMYPPGSATRIEVAGPAQGYEGAVRPEHFRGVATVCTKLFSQTQADVAVFGEKDWQQLQVINRVVADLDLPVRILPHPTVREGDGLACSSRNQLLGPAERALAPLLPRTMQVALDAIRAGAAPAAELARAEARLRGAGFAPDYLALVEPATLTPWQGGPGRLLAAARLGAVRLLDNMAL